MKLLPVCIQEWPKLAWVATIREGEQEVRILHGPMVEVADEWVVEAVWAEDFAAGDFDRTDLVFGTGIRIRDDRAVFVSSGTVFDRLWHWSQGERTHVSNSLAAMLAMAGLSLRDDYPNYSRDVRTVCAGLANRTRAIPLDRGEATATYFNNLVYDGKDLAEEPKPDPAPAFCTYQGYRDYLVYTAERIGRNSADPARAHRVVALSGISSGYDSSAASVISAHAGCTRTVTIKDATSFWRGSDSGAPLAKCLGMSCREYPRTARTYPQEVAVWASEGRAGIMNWTLFDYPEPLCLFFTGWHGEKMWDRVCHDHPDPFVRRDPGSLGFCEFRLLRGIFQCPVPFWAARHNHETRAITLSKEMSPWCMNRDYDKPIARRIVEEAGVPRGLFGTLKKNTSHEEPFRWPYSPDARASFARYLMEQGRYVPPGWLIRLARRAARLEFLVHANVLSKLGIRRRWQPWQRFSPEAHLFQWANSVLAEQYAEGLRAAGQEGADGPAETASSNLLRPSGVRP